jgi:outer membrane protein assembly factor BamB
MKCARNIVAGAFVGFSIVLIGCQPRDEGPSDQVVEAPPPVEQPVPETKATPPSFAWSTYHGNAGLTGVADVQLPDALALAWRFKAGAPVRSTPVAGADRIYFANAKGQVFAVDAHGQEVWRKSFLQPTRNDRTPREEVFDAPLVFVDGLVVAGSASGIVYALDAATGDECWKVDLDGTVLGAPTFAVSGTADNEAVRLFIIEQGAGVLHCLNARTGDSIWQSEGVDRCDASPGIGGGVVVFGSCAAALHIFSADSGEMLREIPIDDDSQVAGGVVIIGDAAFSGSRSGKVLQVNTKTGAVGWVNEDSLDEVFSTPAVNDAWVVVGSADGQVYGLDRATGEQRWAFGTDGEFSSPVIAGDKVLACSEGTLHLLRLADGGELWSHEVSDAVTSPAVAGELVLVGSDDGTVAAFGPPPTEEDATP